MSSIFNMAVVRNPIPAPPASPNHPTIQTHAITADQAPQVTIAVSGGTTVTSLHDRLYAAWEKSNWRQLVGTARAYLDATGWKAPALHPFTVAAAAFLQPDKIAATDYDLQQFMRGFPKGGLKEYLARAHGHDHAQLADHALALHCLGALGEAKYDPIGNLRALHAFGALANIFVEERPGPRPDLKKIVDRYIGAAVGLPHWTFEIDICGDLKLVWGGPSTPLTPLEIRLQRLEQMRDGAKGNCDCDPGPAVCTPQSVCCPELKYYIADLLELRDWTHRYKAGDLAYIEVIAAGEMFSRENQTRRTDEVYSQAESSVRSLEKRDKQVTDTGKLQREINRQNESKLSGKASVEGTYDTKVYKVTASASLSYDKSATQAIKEAQEQSREVVTSAVSELEKQVKTLNSERVTTEETEKNVHTWDNQSGVVPKVTKYFWVTQEKRAQLYSHGKRLMVEMIIPSPARLYERLMHDRLEAEVRRRVPALTLATPQAPAALTITAGGITRENYAQQATLYGVNNPPTPPDAVKQLVVSSSYGEVDNTQTSEGQLSVAVPDGYHAVRMDLSGSASFRNPHWHNTDEGRWIRFSLGNMVWFGGDDSNNLTTNLSNLTGQLSIDVSAANITGAQPSITITCNVDEATMAAWRQSVFDLIEAAYESKKTAYDAALKTYNDAKTEHDAAEDKARAELKDQEASRDPFFNRQIEATEIKRAAIYLMCEEFSAESAWIRMAEPCGFPEIDRHAAAEHGYGWYFWDRLFDWKYMAYAFFDYFWNPICDWPDRFDPKNSDPIFKVFLGAGYARVLIPVSQAMEQDFLWYAATLQKWGQTGEPPLDPQDPRWRNVLYELKYANECAMTPREGHVANVSPGDITILIEGTDRYWDAGAGQVDPAAVAADVDREIFIDGAVYLIANIQLDVNSPLYSGTSTMWWRVTLDRPYEGTASARRLYALGAQAVAPAFSFDMPTELVWAGAHDACLPTYPLPPC
jgi:hypothetical protein